MPEGSKSWVSGDRVGFTFSREAVRYCQVPAQQSQSQSRVDTRSIVATVAMSEIARPEEKVIRPDKAKDLILSSCSLMTGEGTQAPIGSSKMEAQLTKSLIPLTSIKSLPRGQFSLTRMSLSRLAPLAEVPYSLGLTSGKLALGPYSKGPSGTNRFRPTP